MQTPPNPNVEVMKHSATGLFGSLFAWFVGAFKWYAGNLHAITDWLIHGAQIGGFVIMYYSIKILRRNLKQGRNSVDPKENQK